MKNNDTNSTPLPTRSQRLAGNAWREALPQGSKWAGVFEVYPLRLMH